MFSNLIMFTAQTALLLSSSSKSTNVTFIDCDFQRVLSSRIMCCYAINDFSYHNRSLEVSILLNNSKNVQGFSSTNKEIFYMPKELNSIFPVLKFLQITIAKLREISKEDLKNFNNLEFLDLRQNKIEVLEANLFECNHKLREIDFNQNSIKIVDPTAFDGPRSIKSLFFYENDCYDKVDENLPVELKLVRIISHCCNGTHCASNYYMEYFVKNIRTELNEMTAKIEKISKKTSFYQDPVAILVCLNTLALFTIIIGYFYNKRQHKSSNSIGNAKSPIYVYKNDQINQNSYETQPDYEVIDEPQYDEYLYDKTITSANSEDFYKEI